MLLFLLDTNGCRTVGDPWAPEEGITPDNIDYGLVCHEAGIYPDQTAWYRAVAQTAKERNGRTVPSLAFFHIPLTVYDEVFRECYGYEFGVSFDATRPGDYGGIYEHSKHTVDADGSFYRTATFAMDGTENCLTLRDGRETVLRKTNGTRATQVVRTFDGNGVAGKPFMLPQRDPVGYYRKLYRSYNVPEFVTGPVPLDRIRAQKLIDAPERVPFGFRWSD